MSAFGPIYKHVLKLAAITFLATSAFSQASSQASPKYDPATGTYVGPDGQLYTESSLAAGADGPKSWQTMLLPPKGP